MNRDEIRATILRLLGEVAPEADPGRIKPNVSLRDQIDIDSMDFLSFLISVDRELRVNIPEADYGKLATLDAAVDYLAQRLAMEEQST